MPPVTKKEDKKLKKCKTSSSILTRKKTSPVYKFFTKVSVDDADGGDISDDDIQDKSDGNEKNLVKTKCTLMKIAETINGKKKVPCQTCFTGEAKSSTLRAHLKRFHLDVFNEVEKQEKELNKGLLPKKQSLSNLTRYYEKKTKTARINYELKRLHKGIIEFICVEGNSFLKIEGASIKTLLGPVAEAFNISLNQDVVRELVMDEARICREKLAEKLKDRGLIPIKLDFATNHRKSFLGVTTQLIENSGEIEVYTLGCIEVFRRHSAEDICELMKELLKTFNLSLDNVLAAATDNGSNVVKSTSVMNDEQLEEYIKKVVESKNTDNLIDGIQTDTENSVQRNDNDSDYPEEEFSKICNMLSNAAVGIVGIRCSPHTLQLAVWDDTLKEKNTDQETDVSFEYKKVIEKARKVVKKLRNPNNLLVIKERNFLLPIIDNDTRWNSVFDMLERLLKIRDVCDDERITGNVFLTSAEWEKISEIVKALEPFKKASCMMQDPKRPFTDLYKILAILDIEVRETDSKLAEDILFKTVLRFENITNTALYKAAMLLDPRFNVELTEEDKKEAILFLKSVIHRLNYIAGRKHVDAEENKDNNVVIESDQDESMDMDPSEKKLKNHLKEKRVAKIKEAKEKKNLNDSALQDIDEFLEKNTLDPVKGKVLKFWQEHKSDPLYPLARIILSIPFTETTVERLFSFLKYVHNMYRTSLAPETVDSIMFLKSNFAKFYDG